MNCPGATARRTSIAGTPPSSTKSVCSIMTTASAPRSEERRVGKECRCRWWPYHLKNNDRRHDHRLLHLAVGPPRHADHQADGGARHRRFFFFKQKTAYEMPK